jgi:hypothetical protein
MLAACSMLVSCMACSSIMKMDVTGSSKMLADFYGIAWCYIPDDRTFHYLKLLRQLFYYKA